MSDYAEFLARKNRRPLDDGPNIADADIHPTLHEWQRRIVAWAVHRRRAAIWADTGLGKTFMMIEWARLSGDTSLGRMSARRFRKKPVEVEAMRFPVENDLPAAHEVYRWVETNTLGSFDVNELWLDPENFAWPASGVSIDARDGRMVIATLEGGHWVDLGDWIIRGVADEFYPCKPDIFAATYEAVDDERGHRLRQQR